MNFIEKLFFFLKYMRPHRCYSALDLSLRKAVVVIAANRKKMKDIDLLASFAFIMEPHLV